jgi:tetratricopeptide (TPR) repeat protein
VLSDIRAKQGRFDEAVAHSKTVISLPGQAEPQHWQAYAAYLERGGRVEDALRAYKKIVSMFPDTIAADEAKEKLGIEDSGLKDPEALFLKGLGSDQIETRELYFERVRRIAPKNKWLTLCMALALPRVYSSMEELMLWRNNLVAAANSMQSARSVASSSIPPRLFFVVYQGLNDVRLMQQIQDAFLRQEGGLDRALLKPRDESAPTGKIKVCH